MKKLLNILIIAATGIFAASCSDNDAVERKSLQVISADNTSIQANGGSGSIVVEAPVVSATATDSWLTVSANGNTVNISAVKNDSPQARHTTVIINSTDNQAIVNVSQFGSVFAVDDDEFVFTTDEASSIVRTITHDQPLEVEVSDDWLKATVEGNSLTVSTTENTTGHMRIGTILLSDQNFSQEITVRQYDFDQDIAGNYVLMGYNVNTRAWDQFLGTLSLNGNDEVVFKILSPEECAQWSMPFTYDPQTASIDIKAGVYLGSIKAPTSASNNTPITRYVWTMMWDNESGMSTWASNAGMRGVFEYDGEDTYIELSDDGEAEYAMGSKFNSTILRFGYFTSRYQAASATMVSGSRVGIHYYSAIAYLTFIKM